MREWKVPFQSGYRLILAADSRFSAPNFLDDQIWEITWDKNSHQGLTIRTCYGMRVKQILFYPQFILNKNKYVNPADFHSPLLLHTFAANYAAFTCSPVENMDVMLEYWCPESNAIAGRISMTNRTPESLSLDLEWCGLLAAQENGQSMTLYPMGPGHILAGHSSSITPVCYMTGSPSPARNSASALWVPIELDMGKTRRITWAVGGLNSKQESFDLAQATAARQWDAEITRLIMQNTGQTIEITTGDIQWDLALALSQTEAFRLIHRSAGSLPNPVLVKNRLPDQGYSMRKDGLDYPASWQGTTPLETLYWVKQILPGAPEIAASILENILRQADETGFIGNLNSPTDEKSFFLAQPFLIYLCWLIERCDSTQTLRIKYYKVLLQYLKCWFSPTHDRDQDNCPEWDHPQQNGTEQAALTVDPLFSALRQYSIHYYENPALIAFLYKECSLLKETALLLQDEAASWLEQQCSRLSKTALEFYDHDTAQPRYRDFETHLSPAGAVVGRYQGNNCFHPKRVFAQPGRPMLQIHCQTSRPHALAISIQGKTADNRDHTEYISYEQLMWAEQKARWVSPCAFKSIEQITIEGAGAADRILVQTMDFSIEDLSLYSPLWADILPEDTAKKQIETWILPRYLRDYGIPFISPDTTHPNAEPLFQSFLPWVILLGEGLLNCHYQVECAEILTRIMRAIITQFSQNFQFGEKYNTETGFAMGKPNSLEGLAPVDFFLQTAGIKSLGDQTVELAGKNPFPWPITVKYKGMTILRQTTDETNIHFPSGKTIQVYGPGPHCIMVK